MQTPEQKIKELEEKLKRLERHNQYLSVRLTESEDKAAILDKLIDLAETEYLLPVRKNSFPDQSNISAKKAKKPISYLCGLVGINRQRYYRSFWLTDQNDPKRIR